MRRQTVMFSVKQSIVINHFRNFGSTKIRRFLSKYPVYEGLKEKIEMMRQRIRQQGSEVVVDASNLGKSYDDMIFNPHPKKRPLNDLEKSIASRIMLRGPITVAEFMQQALQHPTQGYYSTTSAKFGKDGDFITAPEISQLFGEMIAVWIVSMWENATFPKDVSIVEAGPGRGTLMSDMLRSFTAFPKFYNSISKIHLIETSMHLRKVQAEMLGATLSSMVVDGVQTAVSNSYNVELNWHSDLRTLPNGFAYYVAQELLDALPVHQFVAVNGKWKEVLVDINEAEEGYHFRQVLSIGDTVASKALLQSPNMSAVSTKSSQEPISDDSIEVAPLAIAFVQEIAQRIARNGGSALFIDYGENGIQSDTLRAFRNHKEEHIFCNPGKADLTADVDFSVLRRCAATIPGVKVCGPTFQGAFLQSMGVGDRAAVLINCEGVTDAHAEQIYTSLMRLISPEEMGTKYKVLAVYNEALNGSAIPGFPQ